MESNFFARLLRSPFFFAIILVIFLFSAWSLVNEYARRQKIQNQIQTEQAEIERLKKENQTLSDLIDQLRTNDYVEQEARSKLNLSKPGESLIVVEDPTSTAATGQQQPIWLKWWNLFFDDQKK